MKPIKLQPTSMYGERGPRRTPFIVAILVIATISLTLAGLWHKSQQDSAPQELPQQEVSIPESTAPPPAPPIKKPNPLEEDIIEEDPIIYTKREGYSPSVAETPTMVGYDYFSDAIFIGDSFAGNIPGYLGAVLDDVPVISIKDKDLLSLDTSSEAFEKDLNSLLESAFNFSRKKKVYLCFGATTLEIEKNQYTQIYSAIIDIIKKEFPKSEIFAVGITPVTESPSQLRDFPYLGNAKISLYNKEIVALASEMGVYYIDAPAAFIIDDKLPDHFTADGVTLLGEGYYQWLGYLRKHTP